MKDGLKFVKLCLHSVLYFTHAAYTLTVVDNQSGLTTKKYLRSLSQNHALDVVRYDESFNFAAEVNLGLRHAFRHETVKFGLILNADCVVEPAWLDLLVETMYKNPEAAAVGPMTSYTQDEQRGPREEKTSLVSRLSGFCMLIRRSAFEQVGGFDESYKGGCFEDWDFCVRLQEAGWKLLTDSRVHIHHFGQAFRRRTDEDYKSKEANKQLFFQKHPDVLLKIKGGLS